MEKEEIAEAGVFGVLNVRVSERGVEGETTEGDGDVCE